MSGVKKEELSDVDLDQLEMIHSLSVDPPSGRKRAAPSGAPKPKRKSAAADPVLEFLDNIALPMPHNGGEAVEDQAVTHVFHPMWEELIEEFGERPPRPRDCWGCNRGISRVARLPYEQYDKLCNELLERILEFGLYAACVWAGSHFRDNVVQNMDITDAERNRIHWSGIGIVWHFCKHGFLAHFRNLITYVELQYAWDKTVHHHMFMVPSFGNPNDAVVDMSTAKALVPLQLMLHRARNSDMKKQLNYHPGLATDPANMRSQVHREKFTGSGILHR